MTPIYTTNLLRVLFLIFCMSIGIAIGERAFGQPLLGGMLGSLFGLLIILTDRLLRGFSLRAFSSATFGLLLGVIASHLLLASGLLKYTSEEFRWVISLIVYTAFGYLGMMLAMRSSRDEFSMIIPYVRFTRQSLFDMPVLLDTNILIDSRVEALVKTGVISSSVIIASFVVDELQSLADSSDPLKRERGRRGLESLSEIQNSEEIEVSIHEGTMEEYQTVDQKLTRLAILLQARLLTNDADLCRVARMQHIQVINLNEVASALRPALSPGQILELKLTKEGKDPHQAVGYLEDGTMIVVNNASEHLEEIVEIRIAGTLKTAAGRLYFADLNE